jgi:hypothetical protein
LETAVALQSHCLAALAYYKAPGYVAFRAELPQTASQKLARGEIKVLAAQVLAAQALAPASPAAAPGQPEAPCRAFDLRHRKRRRD